MSQTDSGMCIMHIIQCHMHHTTTIEAQAADLGRLDRIQDHTWLWLYAPVVCYFF